MFNIKKYTLNNWFRFLVLLLIALGITGYFFYLNTNSKITQEKIVQETDPIEELTKQIKSLSSEIREVNSKLDNMSDRMDDLESKTDAIYKRETTTSCGWQMGQWICN